MDKHWIPLLRLPLTLEQFRQMPRHPAYRYEYLHREAHISPRPRYCHAVLDLKTFRAGEEFPHRRLRPADWEQLPRLFSAAFRNTQPFGSLDGPPRLEAAGEVLEHTRTGGDGPLIDCASFVAPLDRPDAVEADEPDRLMGVILVTLLPPGDPADWHSWEWHTPPPADCIEHRLGRPHLTWIFVSPWEAGRGVASALLAASVRELLALGYTELISTFLLGNDQSLLWHWRNGFRLLPYPGSPREMARRWSQQ